MMIIKDIAEYEKNDSELAKYTIANLHSEIERLKEDISNYVKITLHDRKEIDRLNNIINKAIEHIDRRDIDWGSEAHEKLLDILKGDDKND